jgi:hypothetical protein
MAPTETGGKKEKKKLNAAMAPTLCLIETLSFERERERERERV